VKWRKCSANGEVKEHMIAESSDKGGPCPQTVAFPSVGQRVAMPAVTVGIVSQSLAWDTICPMLAIGLAT